MEIETPIPFNEELNELFNQKEFKKTLILWFHYKRRLNPTEVSQETGYARQTVYDTVNK